MELVCVQCQVELKIEKKRSCQLVCCPSCHALYELSSDSPPVFQQVLLETSSDELPVWHMRTSDGLTFGPVPAGQLNDWVMQGRVSADCGLARDTPRDWMLADEIFPFLKTLPSTQDDGSQLAAKVENDDARLESDAILEGRNSEVKPHRGGLILTFGICSWLTQCAGCGIIAWSLGHQHLREMEAGRMDPQGRTATRIGVLLGAIHCIVFILVAMWIFFLWLLPYEVLW